MSLGRSKPSYSSGSGRVVGVVMQAATSNVDSSVSLYKKAVGAKRWEADEGIEERVTVTFADMCTVYGEENAVKMVSVPH